MYSPNQLVKPHLLGISESATLAINELSTKLSKQGQRIFRLGLGQSPFPVPEPVVDALKIHAAEKDYLPVKGLTPLREAVAEFHRKRDLVHVHPDLVLIGPGSKELLFLVQLVFNGDIIVPSPCWVSYAPQASILQNKITVIHTQYEEKWRITANSFVKHVEQNPSDRPRLLILNYPGNPEGCSYTEQELKELAHVCRAHNTYILSDEIYGLLHHEGEHLSVARFYPEGTILSAGLSKWCGAGGWRLGTFSFPPEMNEVMNAMSAIASETYTSVSSPIQWAAIQAFKGSSHIENYLWHSRRILQRLGTECATILRSGGARVHDPEGAFYLFVDFSPVQESLASKGITDSTTLCKRLLEETGVAILPGAAFERPQEELSARLAYVDFDGAEALNASYRTVLSDSLPKDFTNHYCGNVLEGVRRIANWLG